MKVEETLQERNKTHGDFKSQACTAQVIKETIKLSPNWHRMTSAQREALELISTKISRLCHGDPFHKDSWHDIEGYARLGGDHEQ